jgi:hypothetical protein
MSHHPVSGTLRIQAADNGAFPLNVDGSTLVCRGAATVKRCGSIPLICRHIDNGDNVAL